MQKLPIPDEIDTRVGSTIPYLRLPDRASIFADRAARLRRRRAGTKRE